MKVLPGSGCPPGLSPARPWQLQTPGGGPAAGVRWPRRGCGSAPIAERLQDDNNKEEFIFQEEKRGWTWRSFWKDKHLTWHRNLLFWKNRPDGHDFLRWSSRKIYFFTKFVNIFPWWILLLSSPTWLDPQKTYLLTYFFYFLWWLVWLSWKINVWTKIFN